MANEFGGMRVTPVSVPAGIGSQTKLDITNIQAIVFAEMTKWGTGVGDVSIRLGDNGDPFDPAPGDGLYAFFPVRRMYVINNTAVAKKLVVVLHESKEFRLINTPRGV